MSMRRKVSSPRLKHLERAAERTGDSWNLVRVARDRIAGWPKAALKRQRAWRGVMLMLSEDAWREKLEEIADPAMRAKVASIVWFQFWCDVPSAQRSEYLHSLLREWNSGDDDKIDRGALAEELYRLGWPPGMAMRDALCNDDDDSEEEASMEEGDNGAE